MVHGFRSFLYDVKKKFRFNRDEIKGIALAIIILGFCLGFDDGQETFRLAYWLFHLVNSLLLMTLTVLVSISGMKLYGLHKGYMVEFKPWYFGLAITLIVTILSNGFLWWIMLPGGLVVHHLAGQRLGKFRYGINYYDLAWISLAGPLANIILATLIKNIDLYLPFLVINTEFLATVFLVNWVYAFFTFLPIPPLPGTNMLYASRLTYSYVAGSILGYLVLILTLQVYSFIWALLFGGVVWLVYLLKFEKAVDE